MMLSGVGTIGGYYYNTKSGVLFSKKGAEKEISEFIYKKALVRCESSLEATINPLNVSRFREVSTEHYSFVPEPENGKGGLRILIDGESAGVFSVDDLKIRTDEKTGTRVMISEIVGGAWYDAIPVTAELEQGLAEAIGVKKIPEEKLAGYYIGTHAGTGISYVMRPGDEGRGGKVLLQSETDVARYNALAEEYYKKYPNLVSCQYAGKIYASFEVCGMMERTATGIVKIGFDNISYNDNFDSKKNWSIMLSEASWELLKDWLMENRSSMKEYGELQTWTEILDALNGSYARIWPEVKLKFSMEYDKAQRKIQKMREERELKERREQKERMEEALEEYAQYRRELRHYYNELGYQKRLVVSNPKAVRVGSVKRPPVVSAAYELMMMLGM